MSAHRDAVPVIRMQPDLQNQGYAAGVAAAMAAKRAPRCGSSTSTTLQQHLVEIGNLPESVLKDEDSLPLPDEQIAAAVARLDRAEDGAAVFASPERALPLLAQAYAASQEQAETEIRRTCWPCLPTIRA